MTTPRIALAPGVQIDRYELVCSIGEGGMAQVWVAHQRGKHGFTKLFAMKSILPRFAEDAAFRTMFLDEARIAASIEHPNVTQIFDLGESSSMLYIVMEYVDGDPLWTLFRATKDRGERFPIGVALRILADTCAGLHAAHELHDSSGRLRGIVHRDVSPQNLLVSTKGGVKVIDFGIALARDRLAADTNDGTLKGKLHYMAPEQARAEPIDRRADVFSVGAILYKLLTSRAAYEGLNDAQTLKLLMTGGAPAKLPEDVPRSVADIVARALSHQPEARYQTAAHMQAALEAAIAEEGLTPSVATFVNEHLSSRAKERQKAVQKLLDRVSEPDIPSLDFPPKKPPANPAEQEPVELSASALVEDPSIKRAPSPRAAPKPPPKVARAAAPTGVPERTLRSKGSSPAIAAALFIEAPAPPPIAPPAAPPAPPPAAPLAASAMGEIEPEPAPALMDVGALIERAKDVPDLDLPKPKVRPEKPKKAPKAPAPQVRAPAPKRPAPAPRWRAPVIGLALLTVLIVAGLLALPSIVRTRCMAAAADHGINLTVERIAVGISGIDLTNVTATSPELEGVTFKATEVHLSDPDPKSVRVRAMELTLAGDLPKQSASLSAYQTKHAASLSRLREITITTGKVTWPGFAFTSPPENAASASKDVLEIDGMTAEIGATQTLGDELKLTIGSMKLSTARGIVGPWTASTERSGGATRTRLQFDPPVPDGPSALLVVGVGVPPRLTVKIARSPLARIGLAPELFGLPKTDTTTEVQLTLDGSRIAQNRVEGEATLGIYNARLGGTAKPLDLVLHAKLAADPAKPMELALATLSIGPFNAGASGAVTARDDGFRVDLAWRTAPIPCSAIARAETARKVGTLAAQVQDFAGAAGIARVTGTANASGLVTFDTRDPAKTSFSWLTKDTCGVSLFPAL